MLETAFELLVGYAISFAVLFAPYGLGKYAVYRASRLPNIPAASVWLVGIYTAFLVGAVVYVIDVSRDGIGLAGAFFAGLALMGAWSGRLRKKKIIELDSDHG